MCLDLEDRDKRQLLFHEYNKNECTVHDHHAYVRVRLIVD